MDGSSASCRMHWVELNPLVKSTQIVPSAAADTCNGIIKQIVGMLDIGQLLMRQDLLTRSLMQLPGSMG